MSFLDQALRVTPGLRKGHCAVCKEETLWAEFCPTHGDGCYVKRAAPKTCGRLKCMIETEKEAG